MIDLVTDFIVVFYYLFICFLWEQLTSKISEFQKEFLIIYIIMQLNNTRKPKTVPFW